MKPAYHIALTSSEKRLIADLAAIQSQIEWLMQLTVGHLLELSPEATRSVMGSTSFERNSDVWIKVVREKHPWDEAKAWGNYAFAEFPTLARSRNDFMHSLFGFTGETKGSDDVEMHWGHLGTPKGAKPLRVAVRLRNTAQASISELKAIRDRAAYLSLATAHVEWTSDPGNDGSPWMRRLGGRYPPAKGQSGTKAASWLDPQS